MKIPRLLMLLLTVMPAGAALNISGTGTYTQNFNALGTGTVTWTGGTTVPSWYIHRTATTPPASLPPSDGSGSFTGNAWNLGVAGAPDRALGTSPTTSHGNYSRVVLLRNAGAAALQITRIGYSIKVCRTNQFLTTLESIRFSSRIADTEAVLQTPLGSSGTLNGYTADNGLSMSIAFTGAGMPAAPGQVSPPVSFARSAAPTSTLYLNPGQFVALRWEDINESNSTDAYLGLDDVTVEFQSAPCLITPALSAVTRLDNGTPSLLTDDSWSFTLTVTGAGTGSQGWSAPALGLAGAYGGSVTHTLPISQPELTFTVRDVQNPACTAQAVVTAPPPAVPFVRPDRPQSVTFDPAASGAHSYSRTLEHSDLSWSWSGASTATSVKFQPGPVPLPPRYFDFNASNDRVPLLTEPVNLTEAGVAVKVIVRLAAFTTSDSGMENDDLFYASVRLLNSPDSPTYFAYDDLFSQASGAAAFNALRLSDPGINYDSAAFPYPSTPFPFREYSAYIPAGAAPYARVHIEGLNDSNSEHWLVDSIRFETAVCELRATLLDTARSHPQFTSRDPDGDVFTARIAVNNPVPGPAARWVAGGFTGEYAPVNGVNQQYTIGPWPVAGGPVTLTFADADDPACTTTLTISPPPRLVFGTLKARGVTEAICTGGGDLRWQCDEAARTLHMESSTHELAPADENVEISQGITLPGSGLLYVSGIVEATDTSTGSNFESSDFIRLVARCNTNSGILAIPLLTRYDKDGNGNITGYGQGGGTSDLVDYMANIQSDELNRHQRHYSEAFTERLLIYGVLPSDTYYVRVEIAGRNGGNASNSNSEFFTLRELRITSTPPRAGLDWDGDGQADYDEFFTGTDPFDPHSLTRFLSASTTSANGNFTFLGTVPTADGVFYAPYASTDLTTWLRLTTPVAGDGTLKTFNVTDDESAGHTFFKVIARPDNSFPLFLP